MSSSPSACPECGAELTAGDLCDCGLDPDLLFIVTGAASRAANRAVRLAAAGNWQSAADAAHESIRLRVSENDTAVFVYLLARLAGAAGGPERVPAPRARYLPPALRPFVDQVVESTGKLQSIGRDEADLTDHAQEVLNRESKKWPDASWLRPDSAIPPEVNGKRRHSIWTVRFAAIAGVLLAAIAVSFGYWVVAGNAPLTPLDVVSDGSSLEPTPPARVVEVEVPRDAGVADSSRLELENRALKAYGRGEWRELACAVADLREHDESTDLSALFQSSAGRRIYLAGIRASREGRYEMAATLLSAAEELSSEDSYFMDDALYYRARALQRAGQFENAAELFVKLNSEFPTSPYLRDSSRFLEEIRNRIAVGRDSGK